MAAAAAGAPPAKRARLADGVTPEGAGGGEWAEVIRRLQPAIVALKVTCVRSFEEDRAATSLGTGFVVDQERGLVLTNRHITGVGPVRALAIFDRHEELEVEAVYRDPVHDFGFFRYDPSKLRLTTAAEVPLDPLGLRVGAEIRVVGNDAGEKLQILSGTIARVDRNVPEFMSMYNDENTFYAGAGAGTSGGSSGSPVLNKEGRAVALNAAGQEGTASSLFLPLDRVCSALELLRRGLPVPRGSCMASFLFKPFDELLRVGLQPRHEQEVRAQVPQADGMLIVDAVLQEQRVLRPGDILLRLVGEVCPHFVPLEAALDAHVGRCMRLLVCRAGEELELEVQVADLHALVPRTLVELGLDLLHGLGYHVAKRAHLPLTTGVYLARAGFVFESLGAGRMSLITSVNNKPTPTPEAFVEAIERISDKQYFPVSWYDMVDFRKDRTLKTGFAKMSRAWSPLRLWQCHGSGGASEHWTPTDLPAPVAAPQPPTADGGFLRLTGGDPLMRRLQPSLVTVRFRTDRRFCTESSPSGSAEGIGLLIDAKRGLILTDRHSAPQSLGHVEVTLGGAANVDARVHFVHPVHNLAVVQCDPAAMASLHRARAPIRAATIASGARASLRPGECVNFVGFDNQCNPFCARVTVAAVYLPSGRDEFPLWDAPRFREHNLEIVVLADTPEDARGGVLCDSRGQVRALFAAFDWQGPNHEETTEAFGISASVFAPLLAALKQRPDEPPMVPSLDVEVNALDVATLARGTSGALPGSWLRAVQRQCSGRGTVPRAIRVSRVLPTGVAKGLLRPGDVLLRVGGRHVGSSQELEAALRGEGPAGARRARPRASARAGAARKRPAGATAAPAGALTVAVFREGAEVEVEVTPALLGSAIDPRLVIWAGLVLRRTPRCVLERCGDSVASAAGGVFVQNILGGSPADARDMIPFSFLMELGGTPVQDLGDVLRAVAAPAAGGRGPLERSWVRLRLLDLYGNEHVRAICVDPLFFPTLDLRQADDGGWECVQCA